MSNVSIKLQVGVYAQFRNLNNKVWFALAEYVDNAVQSYVNNKTELLKIYDKNYQFEIKISIDKDCIIIYDNAGGIDEQNFQRAFEPANIPVDNTGLHEFGMGMKTASIWLSNLWSVDTAALGETEERCITFDLEKVLAEKTESLKVYTSEKTKEKHFTRITLKKLSHNVPTANDIEKVQKHLASIYRKFIRSGEMRLFINDTELSYEEPEILIASYNNNTDSNPIEWRKEINFSSGQFKVSGFIAILSTMSTNEINGLSLFRRGRVIEGSHDEKYRPEIICGQVGSPRYKRIFGELELEGFSVSFNKGSFQEPAQLAMLMETIRREISGKEFDLYSQAENYIKPKTVDDNTKIAEKIVKKLKQAAKTSNINEKIEISLREIEKNVIELQEIEKKNIDSLSVIDKEILTEIIPESATIVVEEEETSLNLISEENIEIGKEPYTLRLELITNPEISEMYSLTLEKIMQERKLIVYKINLAHPFFMRFDMKNEKNYQPIILIVRSLVLAEVHSQAQGTKSGSNIRMNFNIFLKNI